MPTRLETLRTLLAELEQLEQRDGDRDALLRATRRRIAELEAAPATSIDWKRGYDPSGARRRPPVRDGELELD